MRKNLFTVLISILSLHPSFTQAQSLFIQEFSPEGTASDVKQIKVKFSEDMINFGEANAEAPMQWDCAIKGVGAWLDTKQWVFNASETIPIGTTCVFKVRPGLKDIKGKAYAGVGSYRFSTGGPHINAIQPYEGGTIAEDQVFVLILSGAVDKQSVLEHAFFKVEGIRSPIAVSVIEGTKREKILKESYFYGADVKREKIVLSARGLFPSGGKVSLVWGKGIRSASGTANDTEKIFNYGIREPFRVTVTCTRDNTDKNCNPLGGIDILFNTAISAKDLVKLSIATKAGKKAQTSVTPWQTKADTIYQVHIDGPYQPGETYIIDIKKDLRDKDNRPLDNALRMPVQIIVDDFPPLAKFAGDFGIIEFDKDAAVPITVRNMEKETKVKQASFTVHKSGIIGRVKSFFSRVTGMESNLETHFKETVTYLRRIENGRYKRKINTQPFLAGAEKSNATITDLVLPKVEPPKDMEVVGLAVKQPGFYVFEVQSQRLAEAYMTKDEGSTMYIPAGFMVTNLGVHLKQGRENSLVWVTTLKDATPVKKAKVTVVDCNGKSLWIGTTDKGGVASYKGNLTELVKGRKCPNLNADADPDAGAEGSDDYSPEEFYVFAQKGDDFSFVKNSWKDGIETWRWSYDYPYRDSYPAVAHTVLDRSLLRAGETVHMKHILRNESVAGFKAGDTKRFDKLAIRHQGSNDKFELKLMWDAASHAETAWSIPKEAKLGTYGLYLVNSKETDDVGLPAGSFDVQEFRVPLTKGYLKVPAEELVGVRSFPINFGVQYLAGEGVGNLSVDLSISRTESAYHLNKKTYEGFNFNFGKVSLNRQNQDQNKNDFDSVPLKLDASGNGVHSLTVPTSNKEIRYQIELSYIDPNGETRTFSHGKNVVPDTWHVGVKSDSWLMKDQNIDVTAALVDENSKPLAGKKINLHAYQEEIFSHRTKLGGGVYGYDNERKLKDLGPLCAGTTDKNGMFPCRKTIKGSGTVYVEVKSANKRGGDVTSHMMLWIPSNNDASWNFDGNEEDRMDVLPVKTEYQPGDTAQFQIRSPFPKAKALVTMEREGVVDYEVIDIKNSAPIYDMKVKDNYAPNIYVSVLAIRGRNNAEKPTAMVDLGKPAFKLGKTMIRVGWKANRLLVEVKPEKEVYRVREKARVTVRVKAEDGTPLPQGAEVAIAAVDEGLLELKRNDSWVILDAMMNERPLAVETATAHMQIVGKRHFGLKAMSQGGGGGLGASSNPRELFETLLLWKSKLTLDSKGEASFDVPLNDSLTSFRIAAIATAGMSKFGHGTAQIRATKDLIIYSGIAPIIRDGDAARSKFTLRNTTKNPLTLRFTVNIKELNKKAYDADVTVKPLASVDITVPHEGSSAYQELTFETTAVRANETLDHLITKQKIIETTPVTVQQAHASQLAEGLTLPLAKPADALAGKGGIKVSAQASVISGLDAVRDYAMQYPYTCFEQQTSKVVMLDDEKAYALLLKSIDSYIATNGLLMYFPAMKSGSPGLTSYFLRITAEKNWQVPEATRDRLLAALENFAEGRIGVPDITTHTYTFEKLAAIEALSRYGKAEPAMLTSITLDPNAWPTSAVIDLLSIAHRVKTLAKRDELMTQTASILRGRVTLSSNRIGFTTESKDHLSWLMTSPDLNAIRLVGAAMEFKLWEDDIARYVKGALARLARGHWDLTTANAWGMSVMKNFSAKYEKETVSGTTQLTLADKTKELSWKENKASAAQLFPWPSAPQDLVIKQNGQGKPWILVQSLAAVVRKQPFGNGFTVKKDLFPIQKTDLANLKTGDMIRVKISITAQSQQDWVVVNDPIPAGATLLGKGLGGESQLGQADERQHGEYPTFKELAHDAIRLYYERVGDGDFSFDYTMRLNNGGTFTLPATRVEALYAPDIFAERPNASMVIKD